MKNVAGPLVGELRSSVGGCGPHSDGGLLVTRSPTGGGRAGEAQASARALTFKPLDDVEGPTGSHRSGGREDARVTQASPVEVLSTQSLELCSRSLVLCTATFPGEVMSLFRDRLAHLSSVPRVGAAAQTTHGEAGAVKSPASSRRPSARKGSDKRWTGRSKPGGLRTTGWLFGPLAGNPVSAQTRGTRTTSSSAGRRSIPAERKGPSAPVASPSTARRQPGGSPSTARRQPGGGEAVSPPASSPTRTCRRPRPCSGKTAPLDAGMPGERKRLPFILWACFRSLHVGSLKPGGRPMVIPGASS